MMLILPFLFCLLAFPCLSSAGTKDVYEKRIVTFETDLYPTYCSPYDDQYELCKPYETRSQQIAIAIADLMSTDIVCLQGVYYDDDVENIMSATKKLFPYTHSFNHNNSGAYQRVNNKVAPCGQSEKNYVNRIAKCEINNCHSETDHNDFIACIEQTCALNQDESIKDMFEQLSTECIGCIAAGTYRDARDCLSKKYSFNPTGLLLLSKSKILRYGSMYFGHDHEILRHGYLDVDIDDVGRVLCTVMQPYIGEEYIDISSDSSSYEEKNKFEAEALVQATKDSEKVVIAGCLNSSPTVTKNGVQEIMEQFAVSMDLLKMAGFSDPISSTYQGASPPCTFCKSNVYMKEKYVKTLGGCSSCTGYILDHVLLKGFSFATEEIVHAHNVDSKIYRVLQNELDDPSTPLSSHYGVSVAVIVERSQEDDDEDYMVIIV